MPLLPITKPYVFTTSSGAETTLDGLFKGRRQVIVYHLMFDPSWETPCKSCSFLVDQMPRHLEHLQNRNTTLAFVSRAPIEQIKPFQTRMGWTHLDWYSSSPSDFNYDFHVSLDEAKVPVEYNFASKAELEIKGEDHATSGEQPGFSVFLKENGEILYSYSCYARGPDHLLTTYGLLDLTPLGRQDGEGKEGLGFKYHDEY